MNKKSQADLTVGTIVGFIILGIVIIMMLMRIAQESSSHRFDKKYLSQDMAMFIDTLYASPNPLVVRYPQNIYDYSIVYENSKVIAYWQKEGPTLGESYPFTEDPNIAFKYKTISNNLAQSPTIQIGDKSNGLQIIFKVSKKDIEPFAGLLAGG